MLIIAHISVDEKLYRNLFVQFSERLGIGYLEHIGWWRVFVPIWGQFTLWNQ